MKIDWATKLTSRKFWLAVTGFITSVLLVFNVPDMTINQITGMVTAASMVIAYIIGEGLVDAAAEKNKTIEKE
ncbi:MAG: hypothetical protein FWC28_05485 [Proteobacteria bacterium]|nr:hypothetical protein [Cystobacterineae bacterium]MCL2314687.1 hypothetical protein [Pseudomonadota bacterium]